LLHQLQRRGAAEYPMVRDRACGAQGLQFDIGVPSQNVGRWIE